MNDNEAKKNSFIYGDAAFATAVHFDTSERGLNAAIMPSNEVISVRPIQYIAKSESPKFCKGFTSNISALSCYLDLRKRSNDGVHRGSLVRRAYSKRVQDKINKINKMKELYYGGDTKIIVENDSDDEQDILNWLETLK